MKRLLLSFIILSSILSVGGFAQSSRPVTMTMKEAETMKQIEAIRKSGFADIEIDALHGSLAENLKEIKRLLDLGVDKANARFLYDLPVETAEVFMKDKEGKFYIPFKLRQGTSYLDWPKVFVYEGYAFIYPTQDFANLDKIIFMFKRVNADGTYYVREMRRLINPTPKSLPKDYRENTPLDSSSDIKLEYYQNFNTYLLWPNNPIQPVEPDVVFQLQKEDDPITFEKQRMVMTNYKKILRELDKEVARRRHNIELDRKRMISKITTFNN